MRANLRRSIALAVGLVAVGGLAFGGRYRASSASAVRLARPLRSIVVAHVPDRLRTFGRIDVSRLRCGAPCGVATRTVISRVSRARIAASLERVDALPTKAGFDARWLVAATDANGATTTLACDRFGRTGTVDGRAVTFSKAAPFLAELRREFRANER